MEELLQVNYNMFGEEVVIELSKVISSKCKESAIIILEYLKNNPKFCAMKKDLRSIFSHKAINTIDKWIEILECSCAIRYVPVGSSYFYYITPVGEKILEVLKNE